MNPICSLQLNWREPLISHNDFPMAGGRANHLEPINGLPWWRRGTDLIRTLWVTRRTGGDFIHFPFLLQEISPHFYFQVLVSRRMIWAGWHHMAGVPQPSSTTLSFIRLKLLLCFPQPEASILVTTYYAGKNKPHTSIK